MHWFEGVGWLSDCRRGVSSAYLKMVSAVRVGSSFHRRGTERVKEHLMTLAGERERIHEEIDSII